MQLLIFKEVEKQHPWGEKCQKHRPTVTPEQPFRVLPSIP